MENRIRSKTARHLTPRGFTLVEIMIVVLIIGLLLGIAIPNMIKARERSAANTCQTHLRHLHDATQEWAIETKQGPGAVPQEDDLSPHYLRSYPECPSGGAYTLSAVEDVPTCDYGGDHVYQ